MLQRIQTVWMFLALLGTLFLFITAQDVLLMGNHLPITITCLVLIFIGLLSIFSYKNRKKQVLLNTISIFINILLIGLLIFWLLNLPGGVELPEKGIEPIFPFLSIICLLMANSYIKKDEKLVKSADRLR